MWSTCTIGMVLYIAYLLWNAFSSCLCLPLLFVVSCMFTIQLGLSLNSVTYSTWNDPPLSGRVASSLRCSNLPGHAPQLIYKTAVQTWNHRSFDLHFTVGCSVCIGRVCGTVCVCYLYGGEPVCSQPPRIAVLSSVALVGCDPFWHIACGFAGLHIHWDLAVADAVSPVSEGFSCLLGEPSLFFAIVRFTLSGLA